MNEVDNIATKRNEMVSVAKAMLSGKMHLIEGVRQICSLRFDVNDPENVVFLVIRGIDSETDHFPLGSVRSYCNSDYLHEMDIEIGNYLENARADILKSCQEIIRVFS